MEINLKITGKINLMLDLTSILKNGYHCIHTVMQSVGLYDEISLQTNNTGKITLQCDKFYIPTDSRNTAYKAAELFFRETGNKSDGVNILIKKNIPCQAGMGGGSCDAAGVLAGLNRLYNYPLSEDSLMILGEKIGADVPFCLKGGTAYCVNTGDIVAPIPTPELYTVIIKPKQNISTKEAYKLFDELQSIRHCDIDNFIYAIKTNNYNDICRYAVNVFEQAIEISDRAEIKADMRKYGAGYTMMTGSGSIIFGVFDKKENAIKCAEELKTKYKNCSFAPFCEKSIYFE